MDQAVRLRGLNYLVGLDPWGLRPRLYAVVGYAHSPGEESQADPISCSVDGRKTLSSRFAFESTSAPPPTKTHASAIWPRVRLLPRKNPPPAAIVNVRRRNSSAVKSRKGRRWNPQITQITQTGQKTQPQKGTRSTKEIALIALVPFVRLSGSFCSV